MIDYDIPAKTLRLNIYDLLKKRSNETFSQTIGAIVREGDVCGTARGARGSAGSAAA
jgi:hypothetical protein